MLWIIRYKDMRSAQWAIDNLNGFMLEQDGQPARLVVRYAETETEKRSTRMSKNRGGDEGGSGFGRKNLFVHGLTPHIGAPELESMFSQFGRVVETKVPKGENNMNKGYGFVTFDNQMSADEAIRQMDGFMLDIGKKMRVGLKEDRSTQKSS